ncbi:MAG: hypothetical protein ACO24Y_12530 [Hylemonella sp.]
MAATGILARLTELGFDLSKLTSRQSQKLESALSVLDQDSLARQYPETGGFEMRYDKDKDNWYEGKMLSPTERQVQNARNVVNELLIKPGDYTPAFDVSARSYVDPSNYPDRPRTAETAKPKTPNKEAEKVALRDTDEAYQALRDAYQAAENDPLARDWYAMQQLEQAYIDELGEGPGRQAFKERFADAMAATTGGANPGANFLMAHYGNFLNQTGAPWPDKTWMMSHPIGGRYASGNMRMYDSVLNRGRDLTPEDQPKRYNFSGNFLGDLRGATMDEQMLTGMYNRASLPTNEYFAAERPVARLAAELGREPAQVQDVAWAGFKKTKPLKKPKGETDILEINDVGKPMIQWMNETIARTQAITGQTKEQVLRGLTRADRPMYGAAGIGAMASQDDAQASMPAMDFQPASDIPVDYRDIRRQMADNRVRGLLGEPEMPAAVQRMRNQRGIGVAPAARGFEAPASPRLAAWADKMGDYNRWAENAGPLGMMLPEAPADYVRKMAYQDRQGLLDYISAAAGFL